MKVLQATAQQRTQLNGYQNGVHRLEFAVDNNGKFVLGKLCLDNPAFAAIRSDLVSLPEIDHFPRLN